MCWHLKALPKHSEATMCRWCWQSSADANCAWMWHTIEIRWQIIALLSTIPFCWLLLLVWSTVLRHLSPGLSHASPIRALLPWIAPNLLLCLGKSPVYVVRTIRTFHMNVFPTLHDLLLIIHDYMIANMFFNSFFLRGGRQHDADDWCKIITTPGELHKFKIPLWWELDSWSRGMHSDANEERFVMWRYAPSQSSITYHCFMFTIVYCVLIASY